MMELPDFLEPVGAAPPRSLKAIVAANPRHRNRIIADMGGTQRTGMAGDFKVVCPGNENAIRGFRFDTIFVTRDAREDFHPNDSRWWDCLRYRLTPGGHIVDL